jgi:hypothetical protein
VVHADPQGWAPAVLPRIRAEGPVVPPTGRTAVVEPYRLTGLRVADFPDLDAGLSTNTSASLLDRYPGPLLPTSSAPGVVLLRERLHERLRDRIVAGADCDSMTRWLTTRYGRGDRQVTQGLARLRAGGRG